MPPSTTSSAGQVKGTTLLSTLEFARVRFGDGADRRVLEAMPETERAHIGGLVIPMSWYPLPIYAAMLHALERVFGNGDLSVVYDRGVWSAHHQMSTVLKVIIKVFTPGTVVSKGTRIWSRFHSSGEWQTEWLNERAVRSTCSNFGIVDPAICATVRGWMAGLAQLCRERAAEVVEKQCRSRGAKSCVYEIRWG